MQRASCRRCWRRSPAFGCFRSVRTAADVAGLHRVDERHRAAPRQHGEAATSTPSRDVTNLSGTRSQCSPHDRASSTCVAALVDASAAFAPGGAAVASSRASRCCRRSCRSARPSWLTTVDQEIGQRRAHLRGDVPVALECRRRRRPARSARPCASGCCRCSCRRQSSAASDRAGCRRRPACCASSRRDRRTARRATCTAWCISRGSRALLP